MGQNLAETREMAAFQAAMNQLNQQTPFGSLTFAGPTIEGKFGPTRDPTKTTATLSLSPQQQALLDQQVQSQLLAGSLGQDILGAQPGGGASVFNLPGGSNLGFANPFRLRGADMASAGAGARDNVEQAMFGRAMSLLGPEFGRQEDALRQRLANQGLPQASRAFESELGRFEQGRDRQLEDLAMAAILAGGDEQSRLVRDRLGVSQAGFGQALAQRQQVGSEQLAERQLPFQQALSLFNLGQPQQPDVFAPPATPLTSFAKFTPGGGGAGAGIGSGLGTALGAGAGALLAAPTGGMSMLGGAALGSKLGGGLGGAFGGLFGR